jgi:uncharacterized membrane protein
MELLPAIIAAIAALLCLPDVKKVFWPKLLADKSFQNFTFFICIGLFFLWSAQAGVKEGLQIHFLGLTIFTLMFGLQTGFILIIPIACALAITGQLPFAQLPAYLVLSGLLPVCTSYAVFALSFRYLPRNIFVYIFVAGFFNGGFTSSLHLIANTSYQLWLGSYNWQTISDNYLIILPLLAFPEGLLNGMAAAIMAVFKPEWLRTFSDRHYIYRR